MVLFQSKEFSDMLNDVVNNYVRYQGMQDQVLQDLLEILPVPSNQDFDALAHENYQLKKQVNQLARKVDALEGHLQNKAK
jgi:predicted  nucleic acid-binding Zn-ribbon protein